MTTVLCVKNSKVKYESFATEDYGNTGKLIMFKPTQSQMSLVVSDIVSKNKFAKKRYETVLYTCNI